MRNRTAKFGILAASMIPALFFFASCEIPQSARIKASPTLQIPIPLGDGVDNSFIRPYISVDGIKEQLNGGDKGGKELPVYKYEDPQMMSGLGILQQDNKAAVQTYLITYPIFDMDLDFDKYINGLSPDTSRVPPVTIKPDAADRIESVYKSAVNSGRILDGESLPPSWGVDPFMNAPLAIDLGDMKDLVSNLCFNEEVSFNIKVGTGNAEELREAIRIRVPQFRIGDYGYETSSWVKGELEEKDGKTILKFRNNSPISNDEALLLNGYGSDRISIQIRLVNKITAGEYESEFDFNWYSADIKPDVPAGEFRGFNLGSYLDELGSGADFEKVPAYLYISVPDTVGNSNFKNNLTVNIIGNGIFPITDPTYYSLANTAIKDEEGKTTDLSGWLDANNLSNVYDFTSTLNARNSQSIRYTVEYNESVKIYSQDKQDNQKLTANLAVLLPMVFTFSVEPGTKEFTVTGGDYAGSYIPINMKGLDKFLGSGGSGGGSSTGGDSVIDQINKQLGGGGVNRLVLRLKDIENTVTSDIYLAIAKNPNISDEGDQNPDDWEIVKVVDDEPDRDIDIESAQSLTKLPKIKFLLKETAPQVGGRLYIQSQDDKNSVAFSVKISVIAGVDLDKTIDL
jgi:hypothetical protein